MSVRRPLVDLDDRETWPAAVLELLRASLPELAREREKERAWDLYEGPGSKPDPPATPRTGRVKEEITLLMEAVDLRVFHATRLLDPRDVLADGLRPLSFDERILRLKELCASGQLAGERDLDKCMAAADLADDLWSIRAGKVWATPLRRYLYDGGCDVFFEHWGGEFVQRLVESSPTLLGGIRRLGSPFVVVIKAPILSWCGAARGRLAPTMIDLALRASGHDASVGAWDVQGNSAVPPEWIEAVEPPGAPLVAARST
jgi:hypothetical protein